MIVNSSFFLRKDRFIPDAVSSPTINTLTPTLTSSFNTFIDETEKELLINLLGVVQTNELLNQFETNGDWKETAEQKWKDLVDGSGEWVGMRLGTKSLIADYVFAKWLQASYTPNTSTGVQLLKAENAERVSSNPLIADAWNSFVFWCGGYTSNVNIWHFVTPTAISFYGSSQSNRMTLYGYMSANTDLYNTGFFNQNQITNAYGL